MQFLNGICDIEQVDLSCTPFSDPHLTWRNCILAPQNLTKAERGQGAFRANETNQTSKNSLCQSWSSLRLSILAPVAENLCANSLACVVPNKTLRGSPQNSHPPLGQQYHHTEVEQQKPRFTTEVRKLPSTSENPHSTWSSVIRLDIWDTSTTALSKHKLSTESTWKKGPGTAGTDPRYPRYPRY